MAIRRRRRRNPRLARNSKGRFVKRNPVRRRRRRRARANPIRRRRRRLRANPIRRRRRRNPMSAAQLRLVGTYAPEGVTQRRRKRTAKSAADGRKSVYVGGKKKRKKRRSPAQVAATKKLVALNKKKGKKGKRKAKKSSKRKAKKSVKRAKKSGGKRRYKRRSSGLALVSRLRKAARRAPKRSLRRSQLTAQAHRASVLRKIAKRRGPRAAAKTSLAKAMHIKTNPGISGLVTAAKVLAPQVGAGAGALVLGALAGQKLGGLVQEKLGAHIPVAVVPYVPALSTVIVTGIGYVAADKLAPKYKGAVAIGGALAAVVQAIVAAAGTSPGGLLAKAKGALGLGEYTMVGGGMFPNGGVFREVGEYTLVGGADDATEFAADSLRGLDDATEFAPGEGGVLAGPAGGIFNRH